MNRTPVRACFVRGPALVALALLLGGCGGGAKTVENPPTSGGPPPAYGGPAAMPVLAPSTTKPSTVTPVAAMLMPFCELAGGVIVTVPGVWASSVASASWICSDSVYPPGSTTTVSPALIRCSALVIVFQGVAELRAVASVRVSSPLGDT